MKNVNNNALTVTVIISRVCTLFQKSRPFDLNNYETALISGGSNSEGEVPLKQHLKDILELPQHLRLNLHVGYQSPEALLSLKDRKPVVSFDLPTSDAVVKDVYGLTCSREDFRQLYLQYCRHFKTVAHVTLGLSPENFSDGETDTIKFLSANATGEVVFLIFRPTPETRMADVEPPDIAKVVALLSEANNSLPQPVQIGCMRPGAAYRHCFDVLAWMHGCRKFVMPDHRLLKILEKHHVRINILHNCCAL